VVGLRIDEAYLRVDLTSRKNCPDRKTLSSPRMKKNMQKTETLKPGDLNLADLAAIATHHGPPHEYLEVLRQEEPVHWNPAPRQAPGPWRLTRGFWVLSKYADVVAASRDYQRFSVYAGANVLWDLSQEELTEYRLSIMCVDPPDHTRMRRLLGGGFTPRKVAEAEPAIQAHADRLVAEAARRNEIDLVADLTGKLPLLLLCELLGASAKDHPKIFRWAERLASDDQSSVDGGEDMMAFAGYIYELATDKTIRPDGSMLSAYVNGSVDGAPIPMDLILMLFANLAFAAHETTRSAGAHIMRLMCEFPDQRDLLLADLRARLPNAIEEALRYAPPVMNFRRTAVKDIILHGTKISAGDKVLLSYPSANRDEDVFTDPHRFDIMRVNASKNLAFGAGSHVCLGAAFARMMLRHLFYLLFSLHPGARIIGQPVRQRSIWMNGFSEMRIRLSG